MTFEDVAGIDEAKQELEEVVDFLKDPQKFQRLGGKIPKGVLLVGPPGTGKTLLARAIAGEANVPFFTISGSDFVEMFVGVGASRVRDMFEQGKKNAPCIIFIDEIDAVGRHRGAGLGGGNDEREQTLNQLLVEMDGFEANEGVILIAATNRPDVLDPALLRPGRFDRQVVVPNPDVLGREQILKVHMRKVPLAPDVDARIIARGTPGFSGADLANLVNEAALLSARKNKRLVTMAEFEEAKDKVMMGAERRSMVMSEEEKRLTAYHEAGHALVALHVPKHDPLHKVTIIPRGRAMGVTMSLPEADKYSHSKVELESRLAMAFGGRVAEELVFGPENVTTGAGDDIRKATEWARRMVTEFGFSEKLGPLRYSDNEEEVFLGHSVTQRKNVSDATARIIDEEIRHPHRPRRSGRAAGPDGEPRRPRCRCRRTARVRDAERRRSPGSPERRVGGASFRGRVQGGGGPPVERTELRRRQEPRRARRARCRDGAGAPTRVVNVPAPQTPAFAVEWSPGLPRGFCLDPDMTGGVALQPTGLLIGDSAARAVEAGWARPLAGGPAAFSACVVMLADGERLVRATADLSRIEEWAAGEDAALARAVNGRLERIAGKRPPFAGLSLDRARLIGVVNVTPDSFSDGGDRFRTDDAIAAGRELTEAGADLIDVGGESTRPGAAPGLSGCGMRPRVARDPGAGLRRHPGFRRHPPSQGHGCGARSRRGRRQRRERAFLR